MDNLISTSYNEIVFVGDSRLRNLYPSHQWIGDPPQLIYNCQNEAKIDAIIKMVEEKLNDVPSYSRVLVVVLGLHSDLMDLISSSDEEDSLQSILLKINSAFDNWKNTYANCKFVWCLPCIPDLKRLGIKSRSRISIPYEEQDTLLTQQVRRYFCLVREFKQLWEDQNPDELKLVDLNTVFMDETTDKADYFMNFMDANKFPKFISNLTVDGLHFSHAMSFLFWKHILTISQPNIVDVDMAEQYEIETERASTRIQSSQLSKQLDYNTSSEYNKNSESSEFSQNEPSKDDHLNTESLEVTKKLDGSIVNVFPISVEEVDSEQWLKEELGYAGADGEEEKKIMSELGNELLKSFNSDAGENPVENVGHVIDPRKVDLCEFIPGLSFIIGIKPDHTSGTNKYSYDCVMCSLQNDSVRLSALELKTHVQSRQHVMNVMMVESPSLYELYEDDNLTPTTLLFDEILKYEEELGQQVIVVATMKTYSQRREKIILSLMDNLSAQEDDKDPKYNTKIEKSMPSSQIPLHVSSVERKFKRITTLSKDQKILSILKKSMDEDVTSDITGVGKKSIEHTRVDIAAKNSKISFNNEKTKITGNEMQVGPDSEDAFENSDRTKLNGYSGFVPESSNIKKFTLNDLMRIHKEYNVPVQAIKNMHRGRTQDNIVIVTDDRENLDVNLFNFNEKVSVLKVPGMNFENAFETIQAHPNFGNGTIFVISCGTHDILKSDLLQDCVRVRCPTPPTMLTFFSNLLDTHFLIKKALELNLQILKSTQNDIILFSGITSVKVNLYNLYTVDTRPCHEDHGVSPLIKMKSRVCKRYNDIINMYDEFVIYHAQTLGYSGWNLANYNFNKEEKIKGREKSIYHPNGYNISPDIEFRNAITAKLLCEELLQVSTSSVPLKSNFGKDKLDTEKSRNRIYNEDLMDISSEDEFENSSYEQIAIVTDVKYLPYMKTIKDNGVKILANEDMDIRNISKYMPVDVNYLSRKTLFLIVVGIHSFTKIAFAKVCLARKCVKPLLALFSLPNSDKKLSGLVQKITAELDKIKLNLPKGSNIALLPPVPITLMRHFSADEHHLLHENLEKVTLCKLANQTKEIEDLYPKYMKEVSDLSNISLLKITEEPIKGLEKLENDNYKRLTVIRTEKEKLSYNTWLYVIRGILMSLKNSGTFRPEPYHFSTEIRSAFPNNQLIISMTDLCDFEVPESLHHRNLGTDINTNQYNVSSGSYSFPPDNYSIPLSDYGMPQGNYNRPDFAIPPPFQKPLQPSIVYPNMHAPQFDQIPANLSYGGGTGIGLPNNEYLEYPSMSINRDLDDIIQFSRVIQSSNKLSKMQSRLSGLFNNAFIVGARDVINPLLECNIKSTIIYHNFIDFEESDFQKLVYKMGDLQEKSVCCLVFDISILLPAIKISPGCLTYLCKAPLSVNSLDLQSPFAFNELNMFSTSQLHKISVFCTRLSQIVPVVILPLHPSRIYCDEASAYHQVSHTINNMGFQVVYGPRDMWNKTIQSFVLSWNNIMVTGNQKYDLFNYISSYITSNAKTFLILDNTSDFITDWFEPDIWKAFIEIFLMSLVPKKINNATGIQSNRACVTVTQISSYVPANFFEELFYTADPNVDIIKEKDSYVLKGMSMGKAKVLVKKLDHYHVGDTVLVASLQENSGNEDSEFDLMQSLYILAGFEKVYRKFKSEIIANLVQKLKEVPDIASLKSTPCNKGASCRGASLCSNYHSPLDMRRNPFQYNYSDVLCSKKQLPNGLCQDGLHCSFSHNVYELKFHPLKYQCRVCPSGEPADICNNQDLLCNYAHKDSPEMFYTPEWVDQIVVGPSHSLNYFFGAINAASKIRNILQSNFRVILMSPSLEFLDVAVKASVSLLKKFGMKVYSLDRNLGDLATSQVIVGHPSSFCNLNNSVCRGMNGAIIVDDIQSVLTNERLRDDMRRSFEIIAHSHVCVVNKVCVSTTYEPGLGEAMSEVIGVRLRPPCDPHQGSNGSQSHKSRSKPKISERISHGNFYTQKRSRSKSVSPVHSKRLHVKQDDSRASSPLISKSQSDLKKIFGTKLYDEYTLALGKMRRDFENEFTVYYNMPELYPSYEMIYGTFVEMYKMQHKGKSLQHRERLWKIYWKAKVEDIKKQDWNVKEENLLKEFNARAAKQSTSAQGDSNVSPESTFSFAETLDQIDRLYDSIGFLGPSVKAMIESCKNLGVTSKETYKMFTESENVMLVEMVLEKVKSLSKTAKGETLKLYEKIIKSIPVFLDDAKKGPPSSITENIDVEAIGRASVGKGSKFALDLIKTALAYEGLQNPPKELINALFIKVCSVHYNLAMNE